MKKIRSSRRDIVKAGKKCKKPVTVKKIRRGFNEDNINAVEIAKDSGRWSVSAVATYTENQRRYYSE